MERTSFIFYKSFYDAIRELPKDIQGDTLTAIIEYGLTGETPQVENPVARGMLALVRPMIDANNQHYINGRKGGRPKKPQNINSEYVTENPKNQTETENKPTANQTQTENKPNQNPNVYYNENVDYNVDSNENVYVYENADADSQKTQTDIDFDFVVFEFFKNNRKKPIIEAQRFWDYYSSQNWCKSNGAKLTSVPSAVRMWKCMDEGLRFEPKINAFLVQVLTGVGLDRGAVVRTQTINDLRSAKVQGGAVVLACSRGLTEYIDAHVDELKPVFRENLGNVELNYQIVK